VWRVSSQAILSTSFRMRSARQGDVFEIADRRADKIKAAGVCRIQSGRRIRSVSRLGGRSLRAHAHESSTRFRPCHPALRAQEQCYTLSFEYHSGGASVPLYEYKCLKCGRKHGTKLKTSPART